MERLDLRGLLCPLTWAKTKYALQRLRRGEELVVLLDHRPAVPDIRRNAEEMGHEVLLTREPELGRGRELPFRGSRVAAREEGAAEHAVDVGLCVPIQCGALEDPVVDGDRLGRLTRGQQRLGQPDQEMCRGALSGERDRGLQAVACGRNRAVCHRRASRALQHGDGFRIAKQLPAHRVLRRLRGLGAVSEQVAEGGCVPALSHRWGHVLVQRLPEERVGELRPACQPGPDEPGVDQNPQRLCRLAFIEAGHPCRQHGPELDAEHACGMCIAKVGAGAGDSRQQDRGLVPALIELLEAATASQMARDLLQKQRVAAARRPGPVDGFFRQVSPHPLGEQRGRGRRAQRHQLLQLGLSLLGEVACEVERRSRPGPESRDQGDRHRAETVAEEGDQRQRVWVSPMEVVEQDQRRLLDRLEVAQGGVEVGGSRVEPGRGRAPGDVERGPGSNPSQGFADDPEVERGLNGLPAAYPNREPGSLLASPFQHTRLAEPGFGDYE